MNFLLDHTTDPRLTAGADLHTRTGLPLWYPYPERTPVRPADLRIHLANARRYAGAIDCPILLHLAACVSIAKALDYPAYLLEYVAMHDMHEAYIGDIPTMLKRHLGAGWREIEASWEKRLHAAFGRGLPSGEMKAAVKLVDLLALYGEMTALGHPAASRIAAKTAEEGAAVSWRPPDMDMAVMRVRWLAAGTPEDWWNVLCTVLPDLRGPAPTSFAERAA